jgi:hypothetical protein
MRRRARRRPTAAVVSDAIIIGSNSPRVIEPPVIERRSIEPPVGDAARPQAMRRMNPEVSELEKLSEDGDQWGFSLRDADKAIVTFVYPGREKAAAALKAMRRARKDLAAMELHAARAGEDERLGAQSEKCEAVFGKIAR